MTVDPSQLDAADTDITNPPDFVPNVVDADPNEEDVRDLDEEADA